MLCVNVERCLYLHIDASAQQETWNRKRCPSYMHLVKKKKSTRAFCRFYIVVADAA